MLDGGWMDDVAKTQEICRARDASLGKVAFWPKFDKVANFIVTKHQAPVSTYICRRFWYWSGYSSRGPNRIYIYVLLPSLTQGVVLHRFPSLQLHDIAEPWSITQPCGIQMRPFLKGLSISSRLVLRSNGDWEEGWPLRLCPSTRDYCETDTGPS